MNIKERIVFAYDKVRNYIPQHKWILGGSAAMLLQGIDLGRTPHDINLLIANDTTNEYLKYKRLFNFARHDYGLKLDFLICGDSDNNEFVSMDLCGVNGILMETPQAVIRAKEYYIGNSISERAISKHTHDIEIIKSKIGEWTSRNA